MYTVHILQTTLSQYECYCVFAAGFTLNMVHADSPLWALLGHQFVFYPWYVFSNYKIFVWWFEKYLYNILIDRTLRLLFKVLMMAVIIYVALQVILLYIWCYLSTKKKLVQQKYLISSYVSNTLGNGNTTNCYIRVNYAHTFRGRIQKISI